MNPSGLSGTHEGPCQGKIEGTFLPATGQKMPPPTPNPQRETPVVKENPSGTSFASPSFHKREMK